MKKIKYSYTRQRLFPGFDGKTCKTCPIIATDGEDTVLISYQMLLLSGCDVVYDQYIVKSTDGGKSFEAPVLQSKISYTENNGIRTVYGGSVFYNNVHKKWFGMGRSTDYMDDKTAVMVKGAFLAASGDPLYFDLDPDSAQLENPRRIPFPYEYLMATPSNQFIVFENGDILIAFYYNTPDTPHKLRCVTVRYAFTPDGLEIVKYGTPISDDTHERGICEPSVALLNGKYYMTLRSDDTGLWCESDNGYDFSTPTPWLWDDKTILENYNTQQHWVSGKDCLFLTYTRKGANNDHVFRHRAPIFMTRFDEENKYLIKNEEVILVPELGARLGNYGIIQASENESWLITAEWMQPIGCEKYGSDNSLWLAKVHLEQ